METLQEDGKTKAEPEPSQTSNIGFASEPAAISPKKPIQLGVVQSSIGSRGTLSGSTKKSRWDQGPGPGEVEGEPSYPAIELSQTTKTFNSVKDLVNKFEGISGSSTSNEAEKDESEDKEERSENTGSPTPTRVKLVRTNFVKADKPEEITKAEVNTTHVSASSNSANETTAKVQTKFEKEKETSEVSDLKSITKSKALQIISCNYDSESDESSQEGNSSAASVSKTLADKACLYKQSDVNISTKHKKTLQSECSLKVPEAITETEKEIDDNHQEETCIENTQSSSMSVIECTNEEEKPSQIDDDVNFGVSEQENVTNDHEKSKITCNASTSENIVCGFKSEKLEPVNTMPLEKSRSENKSLSSGLSEIRSETLTSEDLKNPVVMFEEQPVCKTTSVDQDYVKLNEEMNKIKVEETKDQELKMRQADAIDDAKAESTEPMETSDEVDSCVTSDSNANISEGLETVEDKTKVDDVNGIDRFKLEISQSKKGINETKSFPETLASKKDLVTCRKNIGDEVQDWVIVSHDDVKDITSEEPAKSKNLKVSDDSKTLNVSTSDGGNPLSISNSSKNVTTYNSYQSCSLKPEEEKVILSVKNDELEVFGNETDVLDDNLKSPDEDSQTNDNLTENSSKYSDKVDETMEEIFSENLESSSIPESLEKESNDADPNSSESDKTNQETVSFEGTIDVDKKEDHFQQNSLLGDEETNETLLEILESDSSPITTAVTDIALSSKNIPSPVITVIKDSLPENKIIESSGVQPHFPIIGPNVIDYDILKEPTVVKSKTCTLTAAVVESNFTDKNICRSRVTVEASVNKVDCHQKEEEISPVETVRSHHVVISTTECDKESASCKGVKSSKSLTEPEATNNKLDNNKTQGKLVEQIEKEKIEIKLSEEKKPSKDSDFKRVEKIRVDILEKGNISSKEATAKGKSFETNEITNVVLTESKPLKVSEVKNTLETDKINSSILIQTNKPKKNIGTNDMPMEIAHKIEEDSLTDRSIKISNDSQNNDANINLAHTPDEENTPSLDSMDKVCNNDTNIKVVHIPKEEHTPSIDDSTDQTSNNDANIKLAHTPEEEHTLSKGSTDQTSKSLQNNDIDTEERVKFELPTKTVKEPGKCLDSLKEVSVDNSELMISSTEESCGQQNENKCTKETPIEDISTTKPVISTVKFEEFVNYPTVKRATTDIDKVRTSQKFEGNVQAEVLSASASKDNKPSSLVEIESLIAENNASEDVSPVEYSEHKESATDITVKRQQIGSDDLTNPKSTIFVKVQNEPSKPKDKSENKKISEENTELDDLQDYVNLPKEHSKAKYPVTSVVLDGGLSIDQTKQNVDSSSEKKTDSINKEVFDEHTGTTNEILSKSSDEAQLTNKDSVSPTSKDCPRNQEGSTLSNLKVSDEEAQKEPTNEPSTIVNVKEPVTLSLTSSPAMKATDSTKSIVSKLTKSDKVISKPYKPSSSNSPEIKATDSTKNIDSTSTTSDKAISKPVKQSLQNSPAMKATCISKNNDSTSIVFNKIISKPDKLSSPISSAIKATDSTKSIDSTSTESDEVISKPDKLSSPISSATKATDSTKSIDSTSTESDEVISKPDKLSSPNSSAIKATDSTKNIDSTSTESDEVISKPDKLSSPNSSAIKATDSTKNIDSTSTESDEVISKPDKLTSPNSSAIKATDSTKNIDSTSTISQAIRATDKAKNIDRTSKISDEAISKPPLESREKRSESITLNTTVENIKTTQGLVESVHSLDSSEPETVEAIDSFLKQTTLPKEVIKSVESSTSPSDPLSVNVLCKTKEKTIPNTSNAANKAIEKDLTCESTKQPNKVSLETSCNLKNETESLIDTLKEDNNETTRSNKDNKKLAGVEISQKLNISKTSLSSLDESKKSSVQTSKDIELPEKQVEPLKLKLKKTDFEVYSPKRSESPFESNKVTIKIGKIKQADKIVSTIEPDSKQDKEMQNKTSVVNKRNKPTLVYKPLKIEVSNETNENNKSLSKPLVSAEKSNTCKGSKPSAATSDIIVESISKKDTCNKGVVEKSVSDEIGTTEESPRPYVTENIVENKTTLVENQTKRPAESITDNSSDSTTVMNSQKKLKKATTELKNVNEENESLKVDIGKEEISSPNVSPISSQTVSPSPASESDVKQGFKTASKDVPPPVRVSARQKQRQAVAAALAAEDKTKEVKPPVENVTKKPTAPEKVIDKKVKKSVSPTKEIGLKALFVKTTETVKQSFNTGEKSPKLVESKSPSPASPKKVQKELGQVKLEPITLKLSKEDNPVIIRSSSLSPKKVLSPQSPQQKSLGYTLKIGKDSATIVPKESSHSPKLREASPSAISPKSESTNKVGYLIKDTGLTITPVSSVETQEQKLNKITLKLSKAGGHPEIKQEKAETWKAIKKLGEVDIVPMDGKGSAESSKRKEKYDQGSTEKKMKLGDLTIEPSTSSGLSKLQGLLTQAPLNKAESSEEVQFVGFRSQAETSQPVEKIEYDIGLVKPEDELALPKKRGRPRKITSPSDIVHSVTHSGLAASKNILSASLQHQTVQHHLYQQQHMQTPKSIPLLAQQEDADSSIPMFPVPLFDLSDDTFMEPHPTIFPEQVRPETIIMRSARGRPIGRSRRPRGCGLSRGERGGPRGRPRGSRGIKKILEEMEFLSYPDMEQPITLDNIDAEIPRILEPPVSHITEKTMALLRKSIECKKESLEKKRRSDGSDSDNKDSDLDAKVKEMKEKIEAAYKAELESPAKEDKEVTKKTLEKAEMKEVTKKSPEPIPSCSSDAVGKTASDNKCLNRKSTEESAPFHGIGKKVFKRKLSEEKSSEKRKRKSTDEISEVKGKNESKKVKVPTVQDDQKHVKRKSTEESGVHGESKSDKCTKLNETTDNLSDKPHVPVDNEDKVSGGMDVDKSSLTEQPAKSEKQAEAEPETPAKPVKPRPKSKAEIKRIKREKDRLRREAKKLAALEALKAPPPNPSEEDTRMSASDINGDGFDDGFGFKKNRMEVGDPEGKEFCVEYIAEYQWPLQGGELYMIQEQISTYLGVKSFKRKYPDIKRRPVEMEERTYLCDSGLVSESMCDLGLTAVSSSEVLDIMFQDFPDQYEELRKNMRDKAAREIINKQKEKKKFEQSLSKSDLKEHAIQSAQSWNQAMNRSRNESRRCHLDLQTWTVQYPRSRGAKMTRPTPKLGNYPLALIPGQYSDYCKRYTPQELRYWPINTVLYGPLQPNERNSTGGSDGSQSESEDSSSSDDSSESSSDGEGTEEEERDCKVCGGGRKGGESTVRCSQCAHHIHTSCADLKPFMLVHLRKYPWQCSVCKTCQRCNDSKNESKMLFCDQCDRGYHSYCVGLRRVPPGTWTCQLCTDP